MYAMSKLTEALEERKRIYPIETNWITFRSTVETTIAELQNRDLTIIYGSGISQRLPLMAFKEGTKIFSEEQVRTTRHFSPSQYVLLIAPSQEFFLTVFLPMWGGDDFDATIIYNTDQQSYNLCMVMKAIENENKKNITNN